MEEGTRVVVKIPSVRRGVAPTTKIGVVVGRAQQGPFGETFPVDLDGGGKISARARDLERIPSVGDHVRGAQLSRCMSALLEIARGESEGYEMNRGFPAGDDWIASESDRERRRTIEAYGYSTEGLELILRVRVSGRGLRDALDLLPRGLDGEDQP